MSYDLYLIHLYSHAEPREGCQFCAPVKIPPTAFMGQPGDWDALRNLDLQDDHVSRETLRKRERR